MKQDRPFEKQEIRLTVLGERGWTGPAQLVHVSNGVATVYSVRPVENGAPIRLDSGDALLLGECRGCHEHKAEFEAQITLEQIIPSVTDLANLMASICQTSPRTAREAVAIPVAARVRL